MSVQTGAQNTQLKNFKPQRQGKTNTLSLKKSVFFFGVATRNNKHSFSLSKRASFFCGVAWKRAGDARISVSWHTSHQRSACIRILFFSETQVATPRDVEIPSP